MARIEKMAEFTNHQLLLMQIRDTYCNKKSAQLARDIGKDGTYVHRLFYPIGKKGGKGIGLEIMQACNKRFNLPPGYWDSDPAPAATEPAPTLPLRAEEPATQPWIKWPFKTITQQQYALLDDEQRVDIEKYVLLQVNSREPPSKQTMPDHKTETLRVNAA